MLTGHFEKRIPNRPCYKQLQYLSICIVFGGFVWRTRNHMGTLHGRRAHNFDGHEWRNLQVYAGRTRTEYTWKTRARGIVRLEASKRSEWLESDLLKDDLLWTWFSVWQVGASGQHDDVLSLQEHFLPSSITLMYRGQYPCNDGGEFLLKAID